MLLADHLDKLKAFKAVTDSATLREAAQKLNMTQPALTRLIQTLEKASDTKLLLRSRSGVMPTAAGEILSSFASSTLKDLDDVTERLKFPSKELSGHLIIGSYESLAEYLWPDFISTFRKHHPELKISIRTSQPSGHLGALESGDIDMLVDAEPRISGEFTSWVLYEDRFNFFQKNKLNEALTQEDAKSIPLIYCPAAYDREGKTILQHLESNGFYFKECPWGPGPTV